MKRGKFSLSYTKLLSCDMGELIPIGWHEALPGDTIQQTTTALVRCAPLLSPVMHPVEVRFHHWCVPNRLLWTNWEKFITGGPDGLDATVHPTITLPSVAVGSLADYLGVPISAGAIVVSALPFRAYASIFNENYRDQDLVTLAGLSLGDGVDATTSTALKNIAWEKDSYTSARPWEQKGPAISIPLTGSAPVVISETGATPGTRTFDRGNAAADGAVRVNEAGTINSPLLFNTDLTGVSSVTVNALREALALQRYEEARARFGSRYTEYLLYLGVKSADSRLQRPEYLGGGRQTIQFSEVLATAETGATTDVGDMKGHGIATPRSNRYRRYFEEHCIVMTMMSVRPKTMYMQGLDRKFNRRTKEDYWQKELQHIGQDNILNKEIYAAHATPDGTFGWQDRYDEYRKSESNVAGEFRTTTLNYWHLARDFSADPALNSTFVTSTPTKRVFAATSADCLYVMAKHSIQARRLVAQTGSSFIY
nr:MAG TPA: Capsid protein [Microviridae sp.]